MGQLKDIPAVFTLSVATGDLNNSTGSDVKGYDIQAYFLSLTIQCLCGAAHAKVLNLGMLMYLSFFPLYNFMHIV